MMGNSCDTSSEITLMDWGNFMATRAWAKLFRGLIAGLLQNFGNRYGRAPAAFAFISGFHEGQQLEGGLGRDGRNAGLEKFHNLNREPVVTMFIPNRGDAFGADDGHAVTLVSFAVPLSDADATIGPNAGDEVRVSGVGTDYLRATWSEDRVERFDSVNTVPEKIGMMGLEFRWPHRIGRGDIPNQREFRGEGFGCVAK